MTEEKKPPGYGADALLGQVLQGSYRLERQVGVGGMGWVFQATHTKLDEPMAVKILLPHLSNDKKLRDRFVDEGKIQFKLKHPNIVQVTDVIEHEGIVGLVMEWVNGDNLKQFFSRIDLPLSPHDTWRLMSPNIDALAYAHQKGLVHRDIKPANIMLHRTEEETLLPKLADFGIAKLLSESSDRTATGQMIGTIRFMSPEQMKDSKHIDQRSDIYSLGLMLYLMLTGTYPFPGANELIIYQKLHEDPPLPSSLYEDLHPELDRVLLRSLARDADDRYQSCAELSHAFSLALLKSSGYQSSDVGSDKTENLSLFDIHRLLMERPPDEEGNIHISSIYQTPGMTVAPPTMPPHQREISTSGSGRSGGGLEAKVAGGAVPNSSALPVAPGVAGAEASKRATARPSAGGEVSGGAATAIFDEKKHPAPQGASWGKRLALLVTVIVLLAGGGGFALHQWSRKAPSPPQTRRPTATRPGCQEGATRSCYTGPAGSVGKGICKKGQQVCRQGRYGPCTGEVTPRPKELCNNLDDNCEGQIDESFANKGKPCTLRRGACSFAGRWVCAPEQDRLTCQRDPQAQDKKERRVLLKVRPKNRRIRLRYGKIRATFKGSYCLVWQRRRKVTLKAARYHTCIFRLPYRQKTLLLKMKPESNNDLDPPLHYCTRR